MALQDSPSSVWSGSAGAIYPLLRRLETAELLDARDDPEDRRGRRLLALTAKGRDAHLAWMLDGSSEEVAAAVSDTVRSRAFFLGALSSRDRRTFVDDSLVALESFLEAAKVDLEKRAGLDDTFGYLAALGGVYQAEARVRWMKDLRDHLSQDGD